MMQSCFMQCGTNTLPLLIGSNQQCEQMTGATRSSPACQCCREAKQSISISHDKMLCLRAVQYLLKTREFKRPCFCQCCLPQVVGGCYVSAFVIWLNRY